jgi:hypothetical protein
MHFGYVVFRTVIPRNIRLARPFLAAGAVT